MASKGICELECIKHEKNKGISSTLIEGELKGSYMNYIVFSGHFPGFFMDLVGIYVGIYLGIYVGLLPDDLELCGVIRDLMGNCMGNYLRIYMGFYWNMALHANSDVM